MRVISGLLKGKKLEGYNVETTRPTMDRVKESMFASIQEDIPNSIVLDLFCGTGSLGIEALSQGADHCYFVDNNKEILKYLNSTNTKFNIILVDAPYKMKVMEEVITLIDNLDLLSNEGLLVLEFSFDKLNDNYHNLKLIKSKKYSDKFVYIYRKVID